MTIKPRKQPDTGVPRINPELQRLAVPIGSLRPDPDNARERTPENLAAIKASLQRFGQQAPVVVLADGTIKAGNGRWLAAKELGWETIAALRLPKGLEHLADEYALADNRTAELARWNPDRFKALIDKIREQGGDAKSLGFDAQAVRVLLAKLKKNAERSMNEGAIKIVKKVKVGDLWRLGDHFLFCGDSTRPESLERMMKVAGGGITMAFTDPPYNVAYGDSKNYKHVAGKIANDKLGAGDWKEFCLGMISVLKAWVEGDIYLWGASGPEGMRQRLWLVEAGAKWSATIIWKKSSLVIGPANYQRIYEPCFYGWFKKSSFVAGRDQVEVWDFAKPNRSEFHPTMKPIELAVKAIENSSSDGEAVLDLFGGAGTTLLACEQTKRKCRMIELEAHYCDVIIARWEALTKEKAEKV